MKRKIKESPEMFPGVFKKGLRPWCTGMKLSIEHRLRVSQGTKEAMKAPEVKAKLILANRGRKQSEDTKRKHSQRSLEWHSLNRGTPTFALRNARISQAVKASFARDPALREMCREKMRLQSNTKEFRMKSLQACLNNSKPNRPEAAVLKVIEQYALPFKFTGNGTFWITRGNRNFNPDFVDVQNKRIIEVFGTYWHRDIYSKQGKENSDPLRLEAYKERGFKVLVVWEDECKNPTLLQNKIQEFAAC